MKLYLSKLVLTVVITVVGLYAYSRFGPGLPISSVVTQKNDLFTVSGEGKVTVVPDTAIVSVGITSQKPTVKLAQNEANTVINKISEELKKLGLAEKDIKTSNYSIYPQYDYQSGASRITGYQTNVTVTVTVREIDKINQVVDSATSNGANTVGGIQLTVDENRQKELLQSARELAVKEAKTKAESLSRAAGMTLGKIVNIQESGNFAPQPYYAKAMMVDSVGGGGGTSIQPGSTDITSSVTLFYETR